MADKLPIKKKKHQRASVLAKQPQRENVSTLVLHHLGEGYATLVQTKVKHFTQIPGFGTKRSNGGKLKPGITIEAEKETPGERSGSERMFLHLVFMSGSRSRGSSRGDDEHELGG